jgi:DNA/RNA endonuclease G (NUC1)
MKNIFLILLIFISTPIFTQKISIDSISFIIKHGDLSFYLDGDTNSYLSIHKVNYDNIVKITGERSDKWHVESPYGPYKREIYLHSGYDLGHLTPSNITSYNDTVNYTSFSMFNQAPQTPAFNRGKWAQLEDKVVKKILKSKNNAIIITGVIYDNKKKVYLNKSKVKIPIVYYKILVLSTKNITYWMGSNINGEVITTDLKTILDVARKNGNHINITIKN